MSELESDAWLREGIDHAAADGRLSEELGFDGAWNREADRAKISFAADLQRRYDGVVDRIRSNRPGDTTGPAKFAGLVDELRRSAAVAGSPA